MMQVRARKLWKIVYGDGETDRPESKAKVYSLYLTNERVRYQTRVERCGVDHPRAKLRRFVEIWIDERQGRGWELYERVDLEAESISR